MEEQVYQELCQKMAKRGGRFPGMDIPEYYNLIKELFTPEEAAVFNAIPKGYHPTDTIAASLDRNEQEISSILEQMADTALSQPKPGLSLNSGFYPTWNPELCEACETCIENCPDQKECLLVISRVINQCFFQTEC